MAVTAFPETSEIFLSSLFFFTQNTTDFRRRMFFEWQENLEPNTIDNTIVDSLLLFRGYTSLFIMNVAYIKAHLKTKLYAYYSSLLGTLHQAEWYSRIFTGVLNKRR